MKSLIVLGELAFDPDKVVWIGHHPTKFDQQHPYRAQLAWTLEVQLEGNEKLTFRGWKSEVIENFGNIVDLITGTSKRRRIMGISGRQKQGPKPKPVSAEAFKAVSEERDTLLGRVELMAGQIEGLEEENADLQAEIEKLNSEADGPPPEPTVTPEE